MCDNGDFDIFGSRDDIMQTFLKQKVNKGISKFIQCMFFTSCYNFELVRAVVLIFETNNFAVVRVNCTEISPRPDLLTRILNKTKQIHFT